MSETFFPYYERELLFIRQMAQEFARRYPGAANRLMLEPNRSGDPHVEHLIQSFAFLAGRIQHKLDDDFPELTDALLNVVYPHYLAPIPSMAVVQFDLDPARAQLPKGFEIPRGSRLHTSAVNDLPCKFRTTSAITLWPIQLTNARLQSPPFPSGLRAPPDTAAILRFQFTALAGMKLAELDLDRLRFHLNGDQYLIPELYELVFNHVLAVLFRPMEPETSPAPITLRPEQCLFQVGFEADEGLLPYPQRSRLGYRLLTEFFTLPARFLFMDLGGWRRVAQAGFQEKVEVVLFLNRTTKRLEQALDASMFLTGCTPVVNLFEQTAEPIGTSENKYEYRIIPDVAHPRGLEVYSVEAVTSTNPDTGEETEYYPFYSFRHSQTSDEAKTYWYASRRPSRHKDDRGTEVYLSLVDLHFNPSLPADSTLAIRVQCTNRDLPVLLQEAGEGTYFELEAAAPLRRLRCVRLPTAPLRPSLRRGYAWRLVSHLVLNHLSLSDPVEGLAALKEILRLYDFADPEGEQRQITAVNRQLVEGITSMSARRVVGRSGGEPAGGFCRGVEVTLEFDEEKYIGTGVYLFASVLERFLGLYVSQNSFTQLAARTKQREGYIKKWPARAGELPLV